MRHLYQALVSAVPAPFDDWMRAHEAELAYIETRRTRIMWTLGLIPLFFATFGRILIHSPRSLVGGTLMRTIVATLSIVNAISGIGLAVLYFLDGEPPMVAALSITLLLQGLYTLAFLGGVLGQHRELARHVQLVGSTLALAVGAVGVAVGMITNLAAATTDPEYGPLTIGILLGMHGFFSLIAFGRGTSVLASPDR